MKHLKSSDFGCFLLQKMSFWNAKKIATHTVTHTPKRPERFEAHWIGSFLPTQCAFSFWCLFFLHDLLHKGAHGLGSLVLLLPRSVGIGAEGESGIVMA